LLPVTADEKEAASVSSPLIPWQSLAAAILSQECSSWVSDLCLSSWSWDGSTLGKSQVAFYERKKTKKTQKNYQANTFSPALRESNLLSSQGVKNENRTI
jgi:hypothetical protein